MVKYSQQPEQIRTMNIKEPKIKIVNLTPPTTKQYKRGCRVRLVTRDEMIKEYAIK